MRETTIQRIQQEKVIAILRGLTVSQAVAAARALYDGGITLVEVTFDQSCPERFTQTAQAISAIREAMGDNILVGAGTVTSPELAELAYQAGAAYIISPDTDKAVIQRTGELGMVSIPGAYTPTEAKQAYNAGADFVKLFPASNPEYLKAICAPLSHIPFLAVGGVNAQNAADFLKAGAAGVGLGSCLVNKKWVQAGEFDKITEEAKLLLKNLGKV